jgi:superoxide dismutase, Cu-Zn family
MKIRPHNQTDKCKGRILMQCQNAVTMNKSHLSYWIASLIPLASLFAEGEGNAHAAIQPLQNSGVAGTVKFIQEKGGTRIIADLNGLKPGPHGFHVHESGDCSSHDGMSAGGHYNPHNKHHGGPDSTERHVGDLGNIVADQDGHAHYDRVDAQVHLRGPHSVIGRSIIVHEDEDDLKTDPAGNAGKRIGCGKIEAN